QCTPEVAAGPAERAQRPVGPAASTRASTRMLLRASSQRGAGGDRDVLGQHLCVLLEDLLPAVLLPLLHRGTEIIDRLATLDHGAAHIAQTRIDLRALLRAG